MPLQEAGGKPGGRVSNALSGEMVHNLPGGLPAGMQGPLRRGHGDKLTAGKYPIALVILCGKRVGRWRYGAGQGMFDGVAAQQFPGVDLAAEPLLQLLYDGLFDALAVVLAMARHDHRYQHFALRSIFFGHHRGEVDTVDNSLALAI